MTASLQEKNSKYYIVVSNNDEDGKRTQRWYPTGLDVSTTSRKKAEQFMHKKVLELETLPRRATASRKPRAAAVKSETEENKESDILFSDYVRYWLSVLEKRKRVDVVTLQGYKLTAEKHVIPYFDDLRVKLAAVDKKTLQRFFDIKSETMRSDGRGKLSANSIKHIKNVVNLALKEAVKEDLIPSNPCSCVEIPKIEPHQANYYNAQQIRALFDAMQGDVLESLIKITMLFGLRRSEVLGIKWDSIDFVQRRLTILHTVSKVTKAVEKDKTKNRSSRRSFPLSDETLEVFRMLKDQEEENRKLFGRAYAKNDYVFKWPDGRPFDPDFVTRHFSRLLRNNGLPHIRFHELRHSCASLLLNNGSTLKDVQEYLGHSNIKTTADIYGHLDMVRKNQLSDLLESQVL